MKTRRLLALGAAALLLAAGPAGCRETPQEDGTLRIGVAVYKGEDTYISNMTQAMQESVDDWCAETGERIQVSISDAQESQNTQNEQIDRFLSLGYDVLCVNLVDRTDAARVVDKAREADVPLVFFNREPVQEDIDAWDKVYYVGSDARQSAQLQAQIVLDLWESDPAALDRNGDGVLQYMMLEGESRHQDAVIRTEVSVQTLREAGVPLERVESGIANWDRNQAAALTESALLEYPEIELILCNNDDMALGAADAVDLNGDGVISYVMFKGQENNPEAEYRTQYSVEDANAILEEAGHPALSYYDSAASTQYLVDPNGSWSAAAAQDYMTTILSAYSEANGNMVELVIANNDDMGLGAITALQTAGYNQGVDENGEPLSTNIPVFTVDGLQGIVDAINAGTATGAVGQSASGLASAVVTLVQNYQADGDLMSNTEGMNVDETVAKIRVPYTTVS